MENQQVTNTSNTTMFCPNCGKKISRGSSFCPECGTRNVLASTPLETEKQQTASPEGKRFETVSNDNVKATLDASPTPEHPASVTATAAPAQPAPAVEPTRIPCKKCGALLTPRMTFCSVCGKKVAAKKAAPSKKAIVIAIVAVAVVISLLLAGLSIALLAGGNGFGNSSSGNNSSGNNSSGSSLIGKTTIEDKLDSAYSTYCSSTYATLGTDGSYLEIDTNPYDSDDYIDTNAYNAIEKVNNYLGLPSYLFNDMGKTTALMGKQSEDFDDLDLTVSWSYHPDNGLEVMYKAKK